jgi:hypothetical protein
MAKAKTAAARIPHMKGPPLCIALMKKLIPVPPAGQGLLC